MPVASDKSSTLIRALAEFGGRPEDLQRLAELGISLRTDEARVQALEAELAILRPRIAATLAEMRNLIEPRGSHEPQAPQAPEGPQEPPGEALAPTDGGKVSLGRLLRERQNTSRSQAAPAVPLPVPLTPPGPSVHLRTSQVNVLRVIPLAGSIALPDIAQAVYGGREATQRDAARKVLGRLMHHKLVEQESPGSTVYSLTDAGRHARAQLPDDPNESKVQ